MVCCMKCSFGNALKVHVAFVGCGSFFFTILSLHALHNQLLLDLFWLLYVGLCCF